MKEKVSNNFHINSLQNGVCHNTFQYLNNNMGGCTKHTWARNSTYLAILSGIFWNIRFSESLVKSYDELLLRNNMIKLFNLSRVFSFISLASKVLDNSSGCSVVSFNSPVIKHISFCFELISWRSTLWLASFELFGTTFV